MITIHTILTDIDECTDGVHNCDQNCTNIDGGFNCSCLLDGYILHANGTSCIGLLHIGNCKCSMIMQVIRAVTIIGVKKGHVVSHCSEVKVNKGLYKNNVS